MAMEKLILRSVMYGVDKIPDSWFEKVPGGYYRASQKNDQKNDDLQKGDSKGDGKNHHRRYSHHHDDRRRARRDRYEDEHRSGDNRRQERRGRSSYDGSHDEVPNEDERRARKGGDRRRRRHSVDSDRFGPNEGYSGAPSNAYYGDRKHRAGQQARPGDPYFDERQRPVTADSSRSANHPQPEVSIGLGGGFPGAAAAEARAPYPQTPVATPHPTSMPSPQVQNSQPPQTERPRSGSMANGYVPYAHIYGKTDARPQPVFPPPPGSAGQTSAAGPTERQSYRQNPFAQHAPTAADAGAGARYNGQPVFSPQPTWPAMSAEAFTGYEYKPPYPDTPEPSRAADRYSPPYARPNHERRDSDLRRTRSERRPDRLDKKDDRRQSRVDPRAPLNGQVNMPPPPPGPPPGSKDDRRDSAQERDHRRSYRHNDRGYTSD